MLKYDVKSRPLSWEVVNVNYKHLRCYNVNTFYTAKTKTILLYDNITAELLKHGNDVIATELTYLINMIYKNEDVPDDWRHGIIVTLPKKGDFSDCNNWRGITLLSISNKVFLQRAQVYETNWFVFWEKNWRVSRGTGHAKNISSHYEISLNLEFQKLVEACCKFHWF